ncbi:MAG: YbaB/EbfC family nucleoid-associated protein [Alphaproteobacteria bacterium]|nr:YbaB/EbfC family nucleoid-associated protein [Alphaproteobacteria bacterium]
MNIQKMMQQAQQVQFKMQELQEKLKDIEVDGEAGGGLIKVVMTCDGRVKSLDVAAEAGEDKETMEDLIIAAINNATDAKEARVQDETKAVMSEMGLPEDAKLPF